jgi:peptidoglycan/LPS O-acetylase OafA/YrhL
MRGIYAPRWLNPDRSNESLVSSAPERLPGLDILRGVAALAVLGFHFAYTMALIEPHFPMFDLGAHGVEVFFAISGYVILLTAYRAHNRRAFALARFIRLYPAYLVCVCLTTAWVVGWGITGFMVTPLDWLANLTMLPVVFGAKPVDGVYWSLWYEIAYYAAVAMLLPWIKRGYSLHFCAAFLIIALVSPIPPGVVGFTTFFIMGAALYEFRTYPLPASVIIAAAIICGGDPNISLLTLLLLATAARISLSTGTARLASYVGGASYPIYLLHSHIGSTMVFLYSGFGGTVAMLIATVAIVFIAVCVNRYLETPIMAALKRRFFAATIARQLAHPHHIPCRGSATAGDRDRTAPRSGRVWRHSGQ